MSRPPTSSIRYGACAVHHTLPPPSQPVAICSAKRSPFTGAPLPPSSAVVDPLELVGFAGDSPPPPPPPPGLADDGATPGWVLLTARGRRPSTATDSGSSSTFGRCRLPVGGPSTGYCRRTTGTGPVGVGPPCGDGGGALISRTDSAPLPLSDYDDSDSTAVVDHHRLVQPASVFTPAAPSTTRCERDSRDSRSLKNWPHSLATTTSTAVCRL